MVISDKLALEIFTIECLHIFAILAAFVVIIYFWFRAKRSSLLYSFLCLIGTLMIWMISKVFKTVSPTEELRWFFIVTQYFGIEFSGFFLLIFSLLYTRNKRLSKITLFILSIPPLSSFIIVLTNPLHMKFYSYFDFYKDTFGPLFFPTQAILYIYLFIGMILLSLGFTKQSHFKDRKTARLITLVILVPILFNAYYLLVKLTDIPWILNIPFFDFTPITSTIALIFFIIPAFRYRFLDVIPFAYHTVFNQFPDGMAVIKNGKISHTRNRSFKEITSDKNNLCSIQNTLLQNTNKNNYEITLESRKSFLMYLVPLNKNSTLLCMKEITVLANLKRELNETNNILEETNKRLENLLDMTKHLAETKTKTQIAQDVHDIFGHTLIVVLGLIDLACTEQPQKSLKKLSQGKELLHSGVLDLRVALNGNMICSQKTTLEKAILSLSNPAIELDFSVQGKSFELNSTMTDALFRVCQEAMTNALKHGKASRLTIILRFKVNFVELYIIDNGVGCQNIIKSYGLTGMEERMNSLNGSICYGSDGEKGFHLHLTVPLNTSA